MSDWETIGQVYATVIGFSLAIGSLFDKKMLRASKDKSQSRFKDIKDSIKDVNHGIFERYFGPRFLSTRFLLTSSIISLCTITLIAFFRYGFQESIDYVKSIDSAPMLLLVISLLAANILSDWLSWGQTKLFFDLSEKSENIPMLLGVLLSDIIITVTLFVFSFSVFIYAFIGGVVIWDSTKLQDQLERPTYLYLESTFDESANESTAYLRRILDSSFPEIEKRTSVNHRLSVVPTSASQGIILQNKELWRLNGINAKGEEIITIDNLMSIDKSDFSSYKLIAFINKDDFSKISFDDVIDVQDDLKNSKLVTIYLNSPEQLTKINKHVPIIKTVSLGEIKNISLTYADINFSDIHIEVDKARSRFWGSIVNNGSISKIKDMFLLRTDKTHTYPVTFYACMNMQSNIRVEYRNIGDLLSSGGKSDCDSVIIPEEAKITEKMTFSSVKLKANEFYSDILNKNIDVGLFILTSFSLTLSYYLLILISFYSKREFPLHRIPILRELYNDQPGKIIGVYVGFIFATIILIFT